MCFVGTYTHVSSVDIFKRALISYILRLCRHRQTKAYMQKNVMSLLSSQILCPTGLHQEKLTNKIQF